MFLDQTAGEAVGAMPAKATWREAAPRTLYVEDLHVGLERSREVEVTRAMVDAFGRISGDFNPVHFSEDYAAGTIFGGCIAHGILSASFISAVIGEQLPGHGAIYLSQSLKFRAPVRPGDRVLARCRVAEIDRMRNRITLDCACLVGDKVVLDGEAKVLAPSRND